MSSLQKLGLPGLFLALLVGAYVWVTTTGSPTAPPPTPQAASTPASSSGTLSESPFLPTHTPQAAFSPSRDNVTPDLHAELATLQQRVAAEPDDAAARLELARLLRDGHQAEDALAHFEQYVALQPGDHQGWLDYAQTLGMLKQWNKAQRVTEAMLEHFPDDPSALYNLGAIHANRGQFAEARRVWTRLTDQQADAVMQAKAAQALQKLDRLHP
jgi:tetratricopeptide (TPR) repeat protein